MSPNPNRPIAPIVAGGAFAMMIVTFGLFFMGRPQATEQSPSPSTAPTASGSPSPVVNSPPLNSPATSPTAAVTPAPVSPRATEPQSTASVPAPQSPEPAVPFNQTAIVSDPPSNVRAQPNGKILCSLPRKTSLSLYGQQGDWYQTDVCGTPGFIHRSQVQLTSAPVRQIKEVGQVIDPPANVRASPNGAVLCQISAKITIQIEDLGGDWYGTEACGRPGFIHRSQLKF
jgi:serine/threonine protein kinase, bacterial